MNKTITQIKVRIANLRTGEVIILKKTYKKKFKQGRWIAYKPKFIIKRKSKGKD